MWSSSSWRPAGIIYFGSFAVASEQLADTLQTGAMDPIRLRQPTHVFSSGTVVILCRIVVPRIDNMPLCLRCNGHLRYSTDFWDIATSPKPSKPAGPHFNFKMATRDTSASLISRTNRTTRQRVDEDLLDGEQQQVILFARGRTTAQSKRFRDAKPHTLGRRRSRDGIGPRGPPRDQAQSSLRSRDANMYFSTYR